MKKIFSIIWIILLFLITYFLQSNLFTWFNILGVKPNLFIIFAIFIGIFLGKEYGLTLGIIFGLLLDMFGSSIIGINAIILGIIGLLSGILEKNFSREDRFTILFITTVLTLLGILIEYLLLLVIGQGELQIVPFSKILLIEVIYNILIVIIVHPLMIKNGKTIRQMLVEDRKQIKYF